MILWIVLSSILVSSVSFVGSVTLLGKRLIKDSYASSMVSFAAGVMLSAALLDLLPEALEANPDPVIFTTLFAGVVFFFFLERFVLWFHHHHGAHGVKPSSVLIIVGDGVHNFIDGIALAAAFTVSPALGFTTLLAISAHEIPQEIADFSVLTANGMSRKKALLWNFLSGLTALVGALVGIFFLQTFEAYLWAFLAFSAGMFLYIACSDLIPELHEDFHQDSRWRQTIPFILGIALLVFVTHLVEGSH
jgi:zinc and cadmium transporter